MKTGIIPHTKRTLSTWRTGRLGGYLMSMILLEGKLEGAESQARIAGDAIKDRPTLEKKAVVDYIKQNLRAAQKRGDNEEFREYLRLHNEFIGYAFAA